MKRKPYKTYTREFKLEALRMMDESSHSATEVAMQLYKWKEQMNKKGDVPTAKKGRPKKEDQSETAKLRQNQRGSDSIDFID